MRLSQRWGIPSMAVVASLTGAFTAAAGDVSFDFTQDPASVLEIVGNNDQPWQATGGNPGGFLALTYPENSQFAAFAFPNIDPDDQIVAAFRFEADLRVGNPTGDRAADGFAVSFARDSDPLLADLPTSLGNTGLFAGGIPEGGSTTGIAVIFDTWSGNTLPDGADIEGIIVRVDNKTVIRQAVPTRNGACDDATSLQTGPRNAQYWTDGGAPREAGSWQTLCWKKLVIDLTLDAKLTVSWKDKPILENFQTTFFPSKGRIILSGRTGGANENTHFDNLKLTTKTEPIGAAPNAPSNVRATTVGAGRVVLAWDPASIPGNPNARVAYKVYQGDTVVGGLITEPTLDIRGLRPLTAYTWQVSAVSIAGAESAKVSVSATTVAEVDTVGFVNAQVYDNIGGTAIDALISDPKYPDSPDRGFYLNGLSFGENTGFGNTWGDNFGTRIATVLTVPEAGQYRFFIRSDDASQLFINTSGPAIPDVSAASPVAEETGCCEAFKEPGDGVAETSEPITFTAGQRVGVLFLVKEGGGGDWGQVAWRKEGDTTPAGSLQPIRGAIVSGKSDPVGAEVTITTPPASLSVPAYKSATFEVTATTVSPYTSAVVYQWYKNGALIAGATSRSYTIPVVQPGDNGAKYKVLVAVPGKQVESAEATLTVTADSPATVASATGSDSFNQATLVFDQPVQAASAQVAANYTGSGGLTISGARLQGDRTVVLTTSAQTEGQAYTITVANVQNSGGKPVAAGTSANFSAWSLVSGRIRADQFTGLGGAGITDLDNAIQDPKYPNSPDVVRFLNNGFTYGEPNFGDTWGDNHLVAMKGVLRPTQNGRYRFFVRSDDASRLYINLTGAAIPDAKTATPIASEYGCCSGFEEVGVGNNGDDTFPTSEFINLNAGQSYGMLYLVKEGGGGDWGQVAWRLEGDTTSAGSLQPIRNHIYWYGPPAAPAGLQVARTATGLSVTYTGTLQSADVVTGPWTDVAGATSPYSTATSAAARYFRSRQ